jgi:hypothetical protein
MKSKCASHIRNRIPFEPIRNQIHPFHRFLHDYLNIDSIIVLYIRLRVSKRAVPLRVSNYRFVWVYDVCSG